VRAGWQGAGVWSEPQPAADGGRGRVRVGGQRQGPARAAQCAHGPVAAEDRYVRRTIMWAGHRVRNVTIIENVLQSLSRWSPLFALGGAEPLCGVGVVQLGCGYYYSLVLDDKGRVWGVGHNAQVIRPSLPAIRPSLPAILRPACNIWCLHAC
jgi:hypothetical protein